MGDLIPLGPDDVGDPSPVPPTLMTALILQVHLGDKPLRYLIDTGDGLFVGSAEYAAFGRPYQARLTSVEWLTKSPVAVDPTTIGRGSPPTRVLVTRRQVTLKTAAGEVVCIVDQRGEDPTKSAFRFLSADGVPIGGFNKKRVFDRHDRAVARYQTLAWWRITKHVVDNDGAPIIEFKPSQGTKIAFLRPTSHELRVLMICTMLAVAINNRWVAANRS